MAPGSIYGSQAGGKVVGREARGSKFYGQKVLWGVTSVVLLLNSEGGAVGDAKEPIRNAVRGVRSIGPC